MVRVQVEGRGSKLPVHTLLTLITFARWSQSQGSIDRDCSGKISFKISHHESQGQGVPGPIQP